MCKGDDLCMGCTPTIVALYWYNFAHEVQCSALVLSWSLQPVPSGAWRSIVARVLPNGPLTQAS